MHPQANNTACPARPAIRRRRGRTRLAALSLSVLLGAALGAAAPPGGPPPVAAAAAPTSELLNPRHPDRYVVQRGDTLWDIAARFLLDPWFWPEIWQINPEIENPHLIYPGDLLSLVFIDGQPRVILERAADVGSGDGGDNGVLRLSPGVRVEDLAEPIPTIPRDQIRAFLSHPTVLPRDEADALPYVFATRGGNLLSSAGQEVYVRGTTSAQETRYNVVRVGDALVDPDDNRVIGYEGVEVGLGRIQRGGDPATLYLMHTRRETREGDRLLPEAQIENLNFFPRAPQQAVEGQVIAVTDGVSMIGPHMIVVINRGERHGLEPGHVLRVYQAGETVRDTVGGSRLFGERVRLPDEPAALMMVFATFERLSYGLVMHASHEFRVLDRVRNP